MRGYFFKHFGGRAPEAPSGLEVFHTPQTPRGLRPQNLTPRFRMYPLPCSTVCITVLTEVTTMYIWTLETCVTVSCKHGFFSCYYIEIETSYGWFIKQIMNYYKGYLWMVCSMESWLGWSLSNASELSEYAFLFCTEWTLLHGLNTHSYSIIV